MKNFFTKRGESVNISSIIVKATIAQCDIGANEENNGDAARRIG